MRESEIKNIDINESVLEIWANFTFDGMLSIIDEYHIEVKELLKATNFWNEIKNKPVTGKSVTGIREINNKDGGIFKEVCPRFFIRQLIRIQYISSRYFIYWN